MNHIQIVMQSHVHVSHKLYSSETESQLGVALHAHAIKALAYFVTYKPLTICSNDTSYMCFQHCFAQVDTVVSALLSPTIVSTPPSFCPDRQKRLRPLC